MECRTVQLNREHTIPKRKGLLNNRRQRFDRAHKKRIRKGQSTFFAYTIQFDQVGFVGVSIEILRSTSFIILLNNILKHIKFRFFPLIFCNKYNHRRLTHPLPTKLTKLIEHSPSLSLPIPCYSKLYSFFQWQLLMICCDLNQIYLCI